MQEFVCSLSLRKKKITGRLQGGREIKKKVLKVHSPKVILQMCCQEKQSSMLSKQTACRPKQFFISVLLRQ